MCTVTYFPFEHGCRLVSSRDEKSIRKPALPPAVYRQKGYTLVYPKDGEAGGSWIGLNQCGQAAVLLNGGFLPHTPSYPYRMSRGLIFLTLLVSENSLEAFHAIALHKIEPFTLLLLQNGCVAECVWDGIRKHVAIKDGSRPQIWSSVTLYDTATIRKREQWFAEWRQGGKNSSLASQMQFHDTAGEGDLHTAIRMNRAGVLYTVSITGIEITAGKAGMVYHDLLNNRLTRLELNCKEPIRQ